jgi:hypothetical protein
MRALSLFLPFSYRALLLSDGKVTRMRTLSLFLPFSYRALLLSDGKVARMRSLCHLSTELCPVRMERYR